MPIALGYDYDIFVSYARQDDFAAKGQDGWVTQFLDRLDPALRQRLGGSGRSLKIFFDREAIGANYRLPEILAAVKRSALFLVVGSPCYVASDWANQELQTFVAHTSVPSRIFLIEFLPMSGDEGYPASLANHARSEFWMPSKHRHTPMSLSPTSDAEEFLPLVHSLAADLRDKLMLMRVLPRAQSVSFAATNRTTSQADRIDSSRPTGGESAPKRTVLLAQGTDDVEDEIEQMRRFLGQFDDEVSVLPAAGYPQGGEAFRAAVSEDLAKSGLFVQLLGRRFGRKPPDLPEGYTLCQLEAARAAQVPIMQWRHPELETSAVTDPLYREIVTAETVVSSGLEAFKRQILDWVREPQPRPRCTRSSTVFINADDKDMTIAKQVERECLASALTTILPMFGPSSEANRKDLAETLTECDVIVFIYGDTTQDWIRAQLRFFSKVKSRREAEPRLLAICNGPPPKADIGISFPNAQVINCPDGWNLDPIRKLIQQVGQ
jgi:hypothetical protein